MAQFHSLLNFESGENRAIMVNNVEFYKEMNVLTFLRDVGKTLTVNYMLAKDSVKNRLDKGISFTEFSYQLLQAYDFLCLYRDKNCLIQMGGSDQWGNITSGTEFIRRHVGVKAYAITTPLLTKADGSKFGKSTEGNIWLDPNMTSPYKFYQFWINSDDRDIGRFLRYFSFRKQDEIEALEAEFKDDLQQLKKVLAEEITRRIHGNENYEAVMTVSELLFNRKADRSFLEKINSKQWRAVADEIPSHQVSKSVFSAGINVVDFLAETTSIVGSKGDARRAIKGNAISINKVKISDFEAVIDQHQLLHGQYLMIENGKKNKYLVEAI
ncbi:MAG: tyrosine--tRNA ligase, partial [Saprospiraceae bacterium]|nr:tyrosine--tRNA ligase [Saprospiraceae bacterium]